MMARSPQVRTFLYSGCSFLLTAPNRLKESGAPFRANFLETYPSLEKPSQLMSKASDLLDNSYAARYELKAPRACDAG